METVDSGSARGGLPQAKWGPGTPLSRPSLPSPQILSCQPLPQLPALTALCCLELLHLGRSTSPSPPPPPSLMRVWYEGTESGPLDSGVHLSQQLVYAAECPSPSLDPSRALWPHPCWALAPSDPASLPSSRLSLNKSCARKPLSWTLLLGTPTEVTGCEVNSRLVIIIPIGRKAQLLILQLFFYNSS